MSLEQRTKVEKSLAPASRTVAINGTGVNVDPDKRPMIVINNGAIAGAAASFTFKVQDSIDNSVYADVVNDFLTVAQPAAFTASNGSYKTTYKGGKPFLRVAITLVAGTAPTLLNDSFILTTRHRTNPV